MLSSLIGDCLGWSPSQQRADSLMHQSLPWGPSAREKKARLTVVFFFFLFFGGVRRNLKNHTNVVEGQHGDF